jgi:hypothetical protein
MDNTDCCPEGIRRELAYGFGRVGKGSQELAVPQTWGTCKDAQYNFGVRLIFVIPEVVIGNPACQNFRIPGNDFLNDDRRLFANGCIGLPMTTSGMTTGVET